MTTISDQEVAAWLEEFASCVRRRDFDGGRLLFDEHATGFGTAASRYSSLDALVTSQWERVWPRTEEFDFDGVEQQWLDENLCAVAATWHSVGIEDDGPRSRSGRATLVLVRSERGLVAVHSHLSMEPGTAA